MGALSGLRVLDLSRVLAGPFCTQILGDLGAEILKIERPVGGDDTRKWGPPFLGDTDESAYYLSCNRNKRSIAINIKSPEGQSLIKDLIAKSDVVIENFKVGGLEQYGLGYEQLKQDHPALVYCAISGFGQNGPMAKEPGYDFVAQALSGLMASTGDPNGMPMKTGVALSDIMTGLYAAIGILAALRHRDETGMGQMVDLALTDCTLASMTNIAQYYLTSGDLAPRLGNAHSVIVPYQAFAAKDGYIILSVGNDTQFAQLATFVEHPEWAEDERFATNAARVTNRTILVPLLKDIFATHPIKYWIDGLHAVNVPCGPVNTMDKVFDDPQIQARDMRIAMDHDCGETIDLVGSPLKMSETPVSYDRTPPVCGQDTDSVLQEVLDLDVESLAELRAKGIIF